MTREEVIRGLECAVDPEHNGFKNCHSCRYRKDVDHLQYICNGDKCIMDALTLLREQEPVAPVLQSGGNYVCGNCGMYTVGFMHPLIGESVKTWKYCPACGRKVRWE